MMQDASTDWDIISDSEIFIPLFIGFLYTTSAHL